jgi:hypothetical protein
MARAEQRSGAHTATNDPEKAREVLEIPVWSCVVNPFGADPAKSRAASKLIRLITVVQLG